MGRFCLQITRYFRKIGFLYSSPAMLPINFHYHFHVQRWTYWVLRKNTDQKISGAHQKFHWHHQWSQMLILKIETSKIMLWYVPLIFFLFAYYSFPVEYHSVVAKYSIPMILQLHAYQISFLRLYIVYRGNCFLHSVKFSVSDIIWEEGTLFLWPSLSDKGKLNQSTETMESTNLYNV